MSVAAYLFTLHTTPLHHTSHLSRVLEKDDELGVGEGGGDATGRRGDVDVVGGGVQVGGGGVKPAARERERVNASEHVQLR